MLKVWLMKSLSQRSHFLGFIDKDFDEDRESKPESLIENEKDMWLEEWALESMNTNKGETSIELNNSQLSESNPRRDNVSIGVVSVKDSKLEAMKQIIKTKNKKNNKLKLSKKGKKKQDNTTTRNKPPSSQKSTRTLRLNIPKTKLQLKQVRKNVWSPSIGRETYNKIKLIT